jgi:hypothetical protein
MLSIQVLDGPEVERRRILEENQVLRTALRKIALCNDGKGYMPELAQRALKVVR